MQSNEDIPIAYIVGQDIPVCEVAYAPNIENDVESNSTQVIWNPIQHYRQIDTDNEFYKKLIISIIKLICTIAIVIFIIDYILVKF